MSRIDGRDADERQHYGVTFAVLALAGASYALLQSAVAPALPAIQADLHASASATAWLLTGYLLSASVLTPIVGRLGDMFGKEHTLVVALLVLTIGTFIAAIANSIGVLIFARVVQGSGGAIFPLAFGIIRDEFPREKAAQGIALISAILGIGGGLGIVLAGPIIAHFDYHWLFWFPLIAVATATVVTIFFVPESPVKSPGRIDWGGSALLSLWLVLLLLGITQTGEWGWGPARDRPDRRRARRPGGLGAVRGPGPGAARRHGDDADPRRLDGQRGRLPGRRRDVQLVHSLPRVHRGAGQLRLRLRRLGHGSGPLSAALHDADAGGEPDRRLARRAGRLPPDADRRLADLGARLRPDHRQPRRAGRRLRLHGAAGRRHRLGVRLARQPDHRGRAARADRGGDGNEHGDANARRLGGGQLGTSLIAGTVTAAGLPTDHGFTLAFLLATVACLLAGLASFAVPRPPRPGPRRVLRPAEASEVA